MSEPEKASGIGDLSGLGQATTALATLAETEIAKRTYTDVAEGSAKEVGKTLATLAHAGRMVVTRLVNLGLDRFDRWIARFDIEIPPDQQVEADPAIAGPILANLSYMEETNPLTELYLQLLMRAIDRERASEAHPAYVKIIEQLSSDEAALLWVLKTKGHKLIDFPRGAKRLKDKYFPLQFLKMPQSFYVYHSHLASLNLVTTCDDCTYFIDNVKYPGPRLTDHAYSLNDIKDVLVLTHFGGQFADACIPPGLQVPTFDRDPLILPSLDTKPSTLKVARFS